MVTGSYIQTFCRFLITKHCKPKVEMYNVTKKFSKMIRLSNCFIILIVLHKSVVVGRFALNRFLLSIPVLILKLYCIFYFVCIFARGKRTISCTSLFAFHLYYIQ